MGIPQRIILVTRKSRLDELKNRFNTLNQVKFYLEQLGENYQLYLDEHQTLENTTSNLLKKLKPDFKIQRIDRDFLPNFIFAPDDIVVTNGTEGLVANTLKYLTQQPLIPIAYNNNISEINRFTSDEVNPLVKATLNSEATIKNITMAQVELEDGQKLYAVNDLFIGPANHTSAFYQIELNKLTETHSSSGIIVSTGFGSTGWLQSVIAGAQGVTKSINNPLCKRWLNGFEWNAGYLSYAVREPFPLGCSDTKLLFGEINKQSPLVIHSKMGEHGVIFSDGILSDKLGFNAGMTATISTADKQGHLVYG